MKRLGAWIEVDLVQLRENFRLIQNHIQNTSNSFVQIMPIVKANAYGHGMIPCVQTLQEEGVFMFGVALLAEAITLQEFWKKQPEDRAIKAGHLVVLMPPLPEEIDAFCEYDIQCVVADIEIVKKLHESAKKRKKIAKVHLFLDTGMRDRGIEPEQALEFLESCKKWSNVHFVGCCTHFATSDEQDTAFTFEQLNQFQKTIQVLKQAGYDFKMIHAANSAAIFRFPSSLFSMVRPGLSLYGYAETHEEQKKRGLKPILSVKTRVLSIRKVSKNESVGYGRRYYTAAQTQIATIPIGYGDGWSRFFSGKVDCLIQGKRFPIVGMICMDQCMVDIADSNIQLGEEVVLIGAQGREFMGADEIAERVGTIPYEVLTSLSVRLPREYKFQSNFKQKE